MCLSLEKKEGKKRLELRETGKLKWNERLNVKFLSCNTIHRGGFDVSNLRH
jgi:hypothetical protein